MHLAVAGSVLACALLIASSDRSMAKTTVTGPRNVPDFTEYSYKTTNCKNPVWQVSDPVGQISDGQNTQTVTIAWGEGPKAVKVSATCGRDVGDLDVNVMQVVIEGPIITQGAFEDGDHEPDPDYQYERLGDNDGAPPRGKPGIKFQAKITVNGPVAKSSKGPDRITTGFVQVLTQIPRWYGDYPSGDMRRTAQFGQAPPWHDQVTGQSDPKKAWYTNAVGANFTPSPGKLSADILTWDRPKPGWPAKNRQGKPVLEATAVWTFQTFICVATADAPSIYFNRARADWTATYEWQSPDHVAGSQLAAPQTLTLLTDRSQPVPVTGMLVNKGINEPNRTFQP